MERRDFTVNSPYVEPSRHHRYNKDKKCFDVVEGRRRAGYFVEDKKGRTRFKPIEQVNVIRGQVKAWREAGYPHVTGTTRKLLEYWRDDSVRTHRLFWCQIEAMETLIFAAESGIGIDVGNDGGDFDRLCTKLCTGGGKTIVMSMLIAWQVCNKAAYPQDKRFTKNVMIVAPNLTVKDRLDVLNTGGDNNYYDKFCVVPPEMRSALNTARIFIHNWQMMIPDKPDEKSVDKRGPKSDAAFCRSLVGNLRNILVINDEAHHAYRVNPAKTKLTKDDEAATVWMRGLDRIHSERRIIGCYDFSATPFVPGTGKHDEDSLFSWIVSDYSLSDGIEAGIVKTPRRVTSDNTPPNLQTYKSRLYHIYAEAEVKRNLSRSKSEEDLPALVKNAYILLGLSWKDTLKVWEEMKSPTPPVMITVANNTSTAARIADMFREGIPGLPELCSDEAILHIDSESIDKADEDLRKQANTVGDDKGPGAKKCNVISVGMLSEGWDARTVTHIMGLRAFTSQLLCEQVVGRGLRRTSYDMPDGEDGFFVPEYVNVFGVPFKSMFFGGDEGVIDDVGKHEPPKPLLAVKTLPERREYAISWPEVSRLEYVTRQKLSLDVGKVPELVLDAGKTVISAEISPVIDGKADLTKCSELDIERLYENVRLQRMIFDAAGKVYDEFQTQWQKEGVKLSHIGQVIRIVEDYLSGGNVKISPELFETEPVRRKIMLALNMGQIVRHIWGYIFSENVEEILPVIEQGNRMRSTEDMRQWWTVRAVYDTMHSHVNRCVCDSTWEHSLAHSLDHNPNVKAWVKNDHLGFYVNYMFEGVVRRYVPDFLVKLMNGKMLILEVKGRESEQDATKRRALTDWVKAVNGVKVFGEWACDVSRNPADIGGIIRKYA